jgi:hypothetical protein
MYSLDEGRHGYAPGVGGCISAMADVSWEGVEVRRLYVEC